MNLYYEKPLLVVSLLAQSEGLTFTTSVVDLYHPLFPRIRSYLFMPPIQAHSIVTLPLTSYLSFFLGLRKHSTIIVQG
jgi:hypothetical protein